MRKSPTNSRRVRDVPDRRVPDLGAHDAAGEGPARGRQPDVGRRRRDGGAGVGVEDLRRLRVLGERKTRPDARGVPRDEGGAP